MGRLEFGPPVSHVYNPLEYACDAHEEYLRRFGGGAGRVVLVGMNPGPWGMTQTGVPFGEVELVRDWLRIRSPIGRPRSEHPKRPVEGFACRRREVSGRRLWGWARDRFGSPRRFFESLLRRQLLPSGVSRGERSQSDPGSAAGGGAGAAAGGLRRRLCEA